MRLPVRPVNRKEPLLAPRGVELAKAGEAIGFFKTILSNPYDPDSNPDGFINLGTAENYVMAGEVSEFVNKHIHLEPKDFTYSDGPAGGPRLRKAMAAYINRHFHPKDEINIDHLFFANGVTALCEMIAFSICDAGDGVLFSRPIYQAFQHDFATKAKVQCVFVEFDGIDQFSRQAVEKYEKALIEATQNGMRIRGLMLCHPHNPLGRCYPRESIIEFMKLCTKYGLHLIADEIYALSVFDVPDPQAVKFESVLSWETERHIDPGYLHVLYGLSKDTTASGLRLGVIHSQNKQLLLAMNAMSMFHWSGNISEKIAISMLEDEKWMDGFLHTSRERLAASSVLVRNILEEEGVQYYKGANAGFFIWIDLRPFLSAPASASLEARWASEKDLVKRMIENNVFITNGEFMSAEEPGWFRVIFSQEERVVREGMRRVMQTARNLP